MRTAILLLGIMMLCFKRNSYELIFHKATLKETMDAREELLDNIEEFEDNEMDGNMLLKFVMLIYLILTSMFYLLSSIFVQNIFITVAAVGFTANTWITSYKANKFIEGYFKMPESNTLLDSIIMLSELVYIFYVIVILFLK